MFTNHGINLTRIQSRPPKMIDQDRQIEFYADFDGKIDDKNVDAAIQDLKGMTAKVTVIGTPNVPWFPTQE